MNIKEARIQSGLTIRKVSDITGIPYRTLQNWEAGIRTPPDYVINMVVAIITRKPAVCPHCGKELDEYNIETKKMSRYQIVYIKSENPLMTWRNTAEEAHEIADKLRVGGYDVDVWEHTATGSAKTDL